MNSNLPDGFQIELEEAKKKEKELNINLSKRRDDARKNLPTSSLDAKLTILLDDFLNSINKMKSRQEDKLNPQDTKKKKEKVTEMMNNYSSLKKQIDIINVKIGDPFSNDRININKDIDKPMSGSEFQTVKENKFKEQDEMLIEMGGNVKRIKNNAVMLGDEVDKGKPLLNDLERNVNNNKY